MSKFQKFKSLQISSKIAKKKKKYTQKHTHKKAKSSAVIVESQN